MPARGEGFSFYFYGWGGPKKCQKILVERYVIINNETTLPYFVCSLSLVSRRFLRISRDPILWQTIKLLGDAISETETVVRQGLRF